MRRIVLTAALGLAWLDAGDAAAQLGGPQLPNGYIWVRAAEQYATPDGRPETRRAFDIAMKTRPVANDFIVNGPQRFRVLFVSHRLGPAPVGGFQGFGEVQLEVVLIRCGTAGAGC